MHFYITGFYAALLALLFVALTINVIRLRWKHRVGIGDGGVKPLQVAIRIHGNFAEFVPMALVLLAIFENQHPSSIWVHVFGATLFLGRISHALALVKTIGTSLYRQFAVISLFILLVVMALSNIYGFITA